MTAATKNCPACGEQILAVAQKCRYCGEYFDEAGRPIHEGPSAMDRALLPVGRPISAIVAGYAAFFAILPLFGIVPAYLAAFMGFKALKQIKLDPSLSGKGRAWFGIIIGVPFAALWTILLGIFIVTVIMEARR